MKVPRKLHVDVVDSRGMPRVFGAVLSAAILTSRIFPFWAKIGTHEAEEGVLNSNLKKKRQALEASMSRPRYHSSTRSSCPARISTVAQEVEFLVGGLLECG